MANTCCQRCGTPLGPRHFNCQQCGEIHQEHLQALMATICAAPDPFIREPVTPENPLTEEDDFVLEFLRTADSQKIVHSIHKLRFHPDAPADDTWYSLYILRDQEK